MESLRPLLAGLWKAHVLAVVNAVLGAVDHRNVVAGSTVDRVLVSVASLDEVLAGAAPELVAPAAAVDHVVAAAAVDHIVPGRADDAIVGLAAVNHGGVRDHGYSAGRGTAVAQRRACRHRSAQRQHRHYGASHPGSQRSHTLKFSRQRPRPR